MEDFPTQRRTRPDVEARRRADIIQRYATLNPPSAEDDTRFAQELGLTIDSLLRLAAAWRMHAGEKPLRGARTRRPAINGDAGREIMAKKIDMRGVDPMRRKEILRRIRVIQSYLARDHSTSPSRHEAAVTLGVSDNRFDALVREWTLHRRASLMPGAATSSKRWHRLAPDRQRVHEILADIVASAGARESVKKIHDKLLIRCTAEALKPLAISQTHVLVRELRAAAEASQTTRPPQPITPPPLPSPPPKRNPADS